MQSDYLPEFQGGRLDQVHEISEEYRCCNPSLPPQAEDEHIRNAEEFVCLNYLGFVQNVLGRLRTMALTIIVPLVASSYPFDPRQVPSLVLIALFAVGGVAIVKV